jgi:hypothetical protein
MYFLSASSFKQAKMVNVCNYPPSGGGQLHTIIGRPVREDEMHLTGFRRAEMVIATALGHAHATQ